MIHKEIMSYYDMDKQTAQLYAPIDEYLKQTKRFDRKAMQRKYITGIAIYALVTLLIAGIVVTSAMMFDPVGIVVFGAMLALDLYLFKNFIKHYGEKPHPDLVICEDIIDTDGMEKVSRDHAGAVEFTKNSLIGKNYIFIKGRTLARIKDVVWADVIEREYADEDGVSVTYYFSINVTDAHGERVYDLEKLSGSQKKREKRLAQLKPFFEKRQKSIDMVDI